MYADRSEVLVHLSADKLFKFRLQIEKHSFKELELWQDSSLCYHWE